MVQVLENMLSKIMSKKYPGLDTFVVIYDQDFDAYGIYIIESYGKMMERPDDEIIKIRKDIIGLMKLFNISENQIQVISWGDRN